MSKQKKISSGTIYLSISIYIYIVRWDSKPAYDWGSPSCMAFFLSKGSAAVFQGDCSHSSFADSGTITLTQVTHEGQPHSAFWSYTPGPVVKHNEAKLAGQKLVTEKYTTLDHWSIKAWQCYVNWHVYIYIYSLFPMYIYKYIYIVCFHQTCISIDLLKNSSHFVRGSLHHRIKKYTWSGTRRSKGSWAVDYVIVPCACSTVTLPKWKCVI